MYLKVAHIGIREQLRNFLKLKRVGVVYKKNTQLFTAYSVILYCD